jgi:hypothetical protein
MSWNPWPKMPLNPNQTSKSTSNPRQGHDGSSGHFSAAEGLVFAYDCYICFGHGHFALIPIPVVLGRGAGPDFVIAKA